MVVKTTHGSSFRNLLYYTLNEKKNSEILDYNGVSRQDAKGLNIEFEIIRQQNQAIKNPVWHTSISFPKDEKISSQKMTEIANKLIEKMGFNRENNQFLIIRHSDKSHDHCHLVLNRVGFNSAVVNDSFSKSRTVGHAKQIENEFGLTKTQNVAKENRLQKEVNNKLDLTRDEVKSKIDKAIKQPGVNSLQDLQKELNKSGIELNILKHSKTGKEYGATFKMYDKTYKGSDLGKNYTIKSLSEKIKPHQMVMNNLNPAFKAINTTLKIIKKGIELGI